MDARRRQYVPLGVNFASGNTGSRLIDKFGRDGILVWVCLLAAAKKSTNQGTFTYASEPEAWTKLGLDLDPPSFTFTDFVTVLGRLKQTRIHRRGRVVDVVLTHWGDWNKTLQRETEAEKKRRKRAQNTGDNNPPLGGTEVEGEGETPPSPRKRRKATAQSNGNGDKPPTIRCPHCRVPVYTVKQLAEHIELLHPITVPNDPDDIPW